MLVAMGEDTRVASLNGAADSLQGQAVEELGVLQPEVHVAWRREGRGASQGTRPSWGGLQKESRDCAPAWLPHICLVCDPAGHSTFPNPMFPLKRKMG